MNKRNLVRKKKKKGPMASRGKPYGKGKPTKRVTLDDARPKTDDKYKSVPMKTIEERKAAQLEKWRKELGLDENDPA